MLPPYFELYKPFLEEKYYPLFSMSSPFASVNLSCLRRIGYHLLVSSYEKYHFSKQINYADNH